MGLIAYGANTIAARHVGLIWFTDSGIHLLQVILTTFFKIMGIVKDIRPVPKNKPRKIGIFVLFPSSIFLVTCVIDVTLSCTNGTLCSVLMKYVYIYLHWKKFWKFFFYFIGRVLVDPTRSQWCWLNKCSIRVFLTTDSPFVNNSSPRCNALPNATDGQQICGWLA